MLIDSISWQEYFFEAPTVTLDGVVQKDVIKADDESGYIVRYKRDALGRLLMRDFRHETETVPGVVVITGRRRASTPKTRSARAQTKRDRRDMKRAAIEARRRQQIVGE